MNSSLNFDDSLSLALTRAAAALESHSLRQTDRMTDESSPAAGAPTDNPSADAGPLTNEPSSKTYELAWLGGMFVFCGLAALVLVKSIPVVNELPEGASSPIEYVVDVTVARFGGAVVALLLLASAATGLGHNKGNGRPGWDFAAKVLSFGAASFSFYAVWAAIEFNSGLGT
jgi:hypothetical protein